MRFVAWLIPLLLLVGLSGMAYATHASALEFLGVLVIGVLVGSAQYLTYVHSRTRYPERPWRARLLSLAWMSLIIVGMWSATLYRIVTHP